MKSGEKYALPVTSTSNPIQDPEKEVPTYDESQDK